jgi:DNA-directed RNA polymerase III subunit RPC3
MIGETTGYVYAVLLRQLTKKISRCHSDPLMDIGETSDDGSIGPGFVTTMDILDNLSTSVDVSLGIGKASSAEIRFKSAEKISVRPPRQSVAYLDNAVDVEANSDLEGEDGQSDSGDSDYDTESHEAKPVSKVNGSKEGKVRFEDGPPARENRIDQMRQHLLLLAESKMQFVRHCGKGQWTVDFEALIQRLREAELDVVIERTSGRHGLRLVRMLRQKGKLDEKTLHSIALLKKSDVQNKMLEMQIAGFVDIQEVPRDNSRSANRTLFLWFSDTERSLCQLLDNTYKSEVRFLQTLAVHRRKEKDILMLTKRTDVKGREKDVMQKEYYDRFARFLDTERKLLGHLMRLDDLTAVLRDY